MNRPQSHFYASLLTLLSIRISTAVQAAELGPRDFAAGLPILPVSEAAGYAIDLPISVYRGTVHEDLSDLRVFNAQGEAVPYSLTPPRRAVRATRFVPLTFKRDGVAANQIVLDARTVSVPLASLRFGWADTAVDYSGSIKVDTSEDLAAWQTIKLAAPLANLHVNGQTQIDNRVAIVPTRASFWRLSWVGPKPPFEILSVEGETGEDVGADSQRESLAVNAIADAADLDVYTFDLEAHPPVARLNVILPQASTVDSIDIASRRSARDPWRPVAHVSVYRIQLPGGVQQQNPPVEIPVDKDRYWRAHIVHGGGVPQIPLRLYVEWVPNPLTFLARGGSPFVLAYGSAMAAAAESDLSQLPATVDIAPAKVGAPYVLGGPDRLLPASPAFPWSQAALRVATLTSIALLAWLTFWTLGRKRN